MKKVVLAIIVAFGVSANSYALLPAGSLLTASFFAATIANDEQVNDASLKDLNTEVTARWKGHNGYHFTTTMQDYKANQDKMELVK